MVSNFTKIGLIFLIIGICIPVLTFNFQVLIPAISSNYKYSESTAIPSNGTYVDLPLGTNLQGISSTLLIIKYQLSCQDGSGELKYMVLYQSGDKFGRLPGTYSNFHFEEENTILIRQSISLNPDATSKPFNLYLRVFISKEYANENLGNFYVDSREVTVVNIIFATIIPQYIFICGIIILITGFAYNYRKMAKKTKTIDVSWEPTLELKDVRVTTKEKKPRLTIESPKTTQEKKTRTIKKVVSESKCKFCEKSVSNSAFFCPHCYAKLK
ncbi:MAG: hypothetical protein ACTSW1_15925 [Candidatus Hodarchaeales archaeon]